MPDLANVLPRGGARAALLHDASRSADQRPLPATFTIEGAIDFSGLTRSRLYELMGTGQVEARKAGRRTLLVGDSLRAYLANLPRADIRVGRKEAA
jgi:hypothetical protein